jgi:general secretion pathway protein C
MKTANAHAGTNTWTLRLFTFIVWVAVGLCAAYWAFKFITTKPVEATAAIAAPAVVVDTKAVAKLLAATDGIAAKATTTLASVKLTLFGLATTRSGQGVALIATEDKPAKPYRVGAKVTDDLVLKSISKVDATLAASATAPDGQKLELPSRKPATFVASSTPSPAQLQAPAVNVPVNNVANVANNPAVPGAAPNYANTIGTLNPALAESLRPISRFAPRATGTTGAPAMPAPAAASAVSPQAATSTINPSAAASSAATANAVAPPGANINLKQEADGVAR